MPQGPPKPLVDLVSRFDPQAFESYRRTARIRLAGAADKAYDVLLEGERPRLVAASGGRPDALLRADAETWNQIARDVRGGMAAFQRGQLTIRYDLHLGVGFLAATAASGEHGLRFRSVETRVGPMSISEAGTGDPVLMIHGLGATKASFLPTLAALAGSYRCIALDLPGFGDSVKPIGAPYDARFFARSVIAVLDALELERAHVIGNSMGGRVTLEVGLTSPDRAGRLVLLAPSLAWLRNRPWAPLLRLVNPHLGLIQPAPRSIVEAIVARVVPGARDGWTAAGVDEFLRSYLTPRGRAAFYTAARNIYLEEPYGESGLWTRLPGLQPPSLFVWGRQDRLVPLGFERHVREVLPQSVHVELDCAHVPQLERPKLTHEAILRFLADAGGPTARRPRAQATG
jgi:pimeloyl-ACP methyl ester carboxylesterase